MKIKVGGSMSMTLQPKAFESINAMSVFTMEKEYADDISYETIEKESDKINKILEKELLKKVRISFNAYNEKIDRIRKKLND